MLKKVTERIYYLMNDDSEDRPAIGLVKGEKGCLVVDAGNSVEHARLFLEHVSEMELPPISYVVLTHHHLDHTMGLKAFDVVKIASEKTYELAKRDPKTQIDVDILFHGELAVDLGGITCFIKEIVNPHRDDGTIVSVPSEKTLFLGDAAYGCTKEGKNCFDREKLISMMKEVNSFNAEYCLCAHESICTKEEMDWYFNELQMGLEISNGIDGTKERIEKFKEKYKKEPSADDLFFLKSMYY